MINYHGGSGIVAVRLRSLIISTAKPNSKGFRRPTVLYIKITYKCRNIYMEVCKYIYIQKRKFMTFIGKTTPCDATFIYI